MLFSSIPFLFYFLPGVMLAYFLAPRRLKNAVLLIFSLIFYAWGEPKYILLMLTFIVLFYAFGLAIGASRRKKLWLTASIVSSVILLGVFKYADFAVNNLNALLGTGITPPRLALPVGISFYTFQCLSYTVDVYRGKAKPQKNIVSFATYVSLFPQLIAGPIVRYIDVERELDERRTTWDDAAVGTRRFLVGLGKKILLANQFGQFINIFRDSGQQSVLFYWLYAIAFTLHIYFDFSGYSDMAIGLGRIFGFHFPENFRYPYLSDSVTVFWRRWHISLGSWFRDYVYIPLGGNRVGKWKYLRNVLAVWLLTGLWHGASWNFVLWGLFFAVLLLVEKWLPVDRLPGAVRRLYVLLAVVLSFVLFNADDLAQAGRDFAGLFGGLGLPAVTTETLYYLRSYAVLFLAGFVGATPLCKAIGQRAQERAVGQAALWLLSLAVLALCTAFLVDGSFNPFLYFRF